MTSGRSPRTTARPGTPGTSGSRTVPRPVAVGRRRQPLLQRRRAVRAPGRSSRWRGSSGPPLSGQQIGGPEPWIGPEADLEARRRRCPGSSQPAAGHLAAAQQRVEPDRPARRRRRVTHEVVAPAGQVDGDRARRRAAAGSAASRPPAARPRGSGAPPSPGSCRSRPAGRPASSASAGADGALGHPVHRRDRREGGQRLGLLGGPPDPPLPGPPPGSTRVRTDPARRPCRARVVAAARSARRGAPGAAGRPAQTAVSAGSASRSPASSPSTTGTSARAASTGPRLAAPEFDRGRADGAERAHPGRQQLVQPPAQRRPAAPTSASASPRPGRRRRRPGRPRPATSSATAGPAPRCRAAAPRSRRAAGSAGAAPRRGVGGRAAPQPLERGAAGRRRRPSSPGTASRPGEAGRPAGQQERRGAPSGRLGRRPPRPASRSRHPRGR